MGSRRWLLWGLGVAAVVLVVGRAVSALVVERAFLEAAGVPGLFTERWTDQLLLQGGAWLAGSLFAFANLHAVRRTILAVAVPARVANLEMTAMVPGPRLLLATVLIAATVGALLAAPLDHWPLVAMVRHGVPFREIEGILGRDLGFYVYWLPLEESLYLWALVSVVTVTAMVVVLYALTRSLRMEGRRIAASTHVRRHLSVLGAQVLLLLAWSYRLDAFDLLQVGSGPDGLFTPVDHRVTLRMDFLLAMGSAAAALVLFRAGWLGHLRVAFGTLTVVLLAAVGLRHLTPMAVRRQQARVPEPTLPAYREMRALFSRHAYGVGALRRLPVAGSATAGPLVAEDAAADAVAWPGLAGSLARAVAGEGEGAASVLVGWHANGSTLGATVVVPPREGAEGWTVRRVPLARTGVPQADGAARPDAAILVAPGAVGHREVPDGTGRGVLGAPLASPVARVAHAWALRDPALLRSGNRPAGTVVVLHRDVRERIRQVAPVFAQGGEVTPVEVAGRLAWAVHLYAVSDRFPLSQRWTLGTEVVSYTRLGATALVDAGTGAVRLVPVRDPDPITRSWLALVPPLVERPGDTGQGRAGTEPDPLDALPPATEGALLQLRTVEAYGAAGLGAGRVRLPDSALVGGGASAQAMRVSGRPVVGWSLPLLAPEGQVVAVLSAVGGAARSTWWSPVAPPAIRWDATTQALAVASGTPSAGAQGGGRPVTIRTAGGVLVATTGPSGRVAVADGAGVGAGSSFPEAMRQLRPGDPLWRQPVAARGEPAPSLTSAARQVDRMREAMRRGDWAAFGTAFDSLARAVGRPPP